MVDNLAQWQDKKVIVTHNLDKPNDEGHTCVETEGLITLVNEAVGIILKPTGKTLGALIKSKDIEDIVLAPTTLRVFKQKTIRRVTLETARQHLLDRHGMALEAVNVTNEEDALEHHSKIDHEPLGHNHAAEDEGDDE